MTDALATTYPAHLATMRQRADAALAKAKREHLVIPAGVLRYKFRDDMPYPFVVSPHFKAWLPVLQAPGSWLVYTPGQKPKLVYLQPRDYWHVVPQAPEGYWVDHFEIVIVREAEDARAELPQDPGGCAVLGEDSSALGDMIPDNPQALVDHLHYARACKTDYEIECMRRASRVGVAGHRAAEMAFRSGESEFGIHMAYLHASGQTEPELPYGSIIALDTHGAVLHYSHFQRTPSAHNHSFLIDAGGSFNGYASDITRSYATPDASEFQALIDMMDSAQRTLCAKVRDGQSYADLHVLAHHLVGDILHDQGFIDIDGEAALGAGITRAFFPHGLGHGIGLQVHDIGGFMAGPEGGRIEPPEGHPFLRLTRPLARGMVVTIEPGLYFIDMLLAELKATPAARHVRWDKVDAFRKYGGIRIEDDVV
ncbi:MAG TPA: Xaa-Pro dipeptidase, partial [Rhodanobacteraceae bacterium]|nr:Xaa-Pro dipeptidase [Rhodanobacteraceae bacterium]